MSERYDPTKIYCRQDEWNVSYDVHYSSGIVVLKVFKIIGPGLFARHPEHDGITFDQMSDAKNYALSVGLIHEYRPKIK